MKNSIRIYCDRENLVEVRKFVANSLREAPLTEIEVNKLVLAVDEVCANVMIHSANCDQAKSFQVFTDIKPEKATFEILDRGEGYDIRNHKMPLLSDIIKTRRKGGVGLLLVHKIMDKIDFIPNTKGNIIRLIKHF